MPLNESGYYSDILDKEVVTGVVTVGTIAVEARVGGAPLSQRQAIRIYNKSNATIYFGPSGVTTTNGEPIEKNNWVMIPAGPSLSIYLIAGTASNDVVVSEWA
jgi:hypothetical protein